MHKGKLEFRYMAASRKCSTTEIAKKATECLKLVLHQHRQYWALERRTQVKRMRVIDDYSGVLQRIRDLNGDHKMRLEHIRLHHLIHHNPARRSQNQIEVGHR